MAVVQPDTGHIPSSMMPIFIAVPSAAFGLGAGLLYGVLAVAFGVEARLGTTGRAILGAGIGGATGIVFMKILAHSYFTILVAVILGVFLGAGFFVRKHRMGSPS